MPRRQVLSQPDERAPLLGALIVMCREARGDLSKRGDDKRPAW